MKESGSTVNGFEMGNIILFDPDRINHGLLTILKTEIEDVFGMRIADGKTEGRLSYQFVENRGLIVLTRCDIKFDVFSVDTGGNH